MHISSRSRQLAQALASELGVLRKMNPYRVIKEDDTSITYEYRSIHTWVLLAGLLLAAIGYLMKNDPIMVFGCVITFIPFFLRFTLGAEPTKRIKKALKIGSVEFSGSKYSFRNPIRITIKKL